MFTVSMNVQGSVQVMGKTAINLFASPQKHKLPMWFSRQQSQGATAVIAVTQTWRGLHVYDFPPKSLNQRSLFKIRDEEVVEAIVVVPYWEERVVHITPSAGHRNFCNVTPLDRSTGLAPRRQRSVVPSGSIKPSALGIEGEWCTWQAASFSRQTLPIQCMMVDGQLL